MSYLHQLLGLYFLQTLSSRSGPYFALQLITTFTFVSYCLLEDLQNYPEPSAFGLVIFRNVYILDLPKYSAVLRPHFTNDTILFLK